MNNVTISPVNGQTGLINKFNNSEDKGYLLLKQSKIEFTNGWAQAKVRTALLKGELTILQQIVREAGQKLQLPGRIVVQEFVESEVPATLYDAFSNDNLSREENLDAMAKTTGGADAMHLVVGGERIMRFAYYDGSGTGVDITVKHDNGAEISTMRKEQAAIAASLPGSGN